MLRVTDMMQGLSQSHMMNDDEVRLHAADNVSAPFVARTAEPIMIATMTFMTFLIQLFTVL